ncbi:MAG: YceI family protein, partial [Nitrospira sp.]
MLRTVASVKRHGTRKKRRAGQMIRMGQIGLLAGMLVGLWAVTAEAEMARYDVDMDHSTIGFSVAHMVVSKTTGRFMEATGVVEMDAEARQFKTIEATIKTASINTTHQKRDSHLRAPDFFDVEQFPTITFKMKTYQTAGDR